MLVESAGRHHALSYVISLVDIDNPRACQLVSRRHYGDVGSLCASGRSGYLKADLIVDELTIYFGTVNTDLDIGLNRHYIVDGDPTFSTNMTNNSESSPLRA